MAKRKKKSSEPAVIPRARSAHARQRQRLIDACISALHIYGPSRTTVEKVVAIAKMSPGIVRFYFASKAAMLVASLQFLAAEFEEQLMVPVARLKSRPVAALELMVDLYLDPEIASPRKVSVWYAFWGEASSRQEYYDICGQKDESFAALVRDLIERLIVETSQPHLDPDGIALGFIGALEMLWQDFAFRAESDIDRAAAKERCMAYLRSVFPGRFATRTDAADRTGGEGPLAGWAYENARLWALERQLVFSESWQLAGHRAQIPLAGDFLGVDFGFERALIVRGAAGDVRAFRNSCSEAPHILIAAASGRVSRIVCAVHGLEFDLDGRRRRGRGTGDLKPLELRMAGNLILVRSAERHRLGGPDDSGSEWNIHAESRPTGLPEESPVAADWKLIVEQSLESMSNDSVRRPDAARWSVREYRALLALSVDSNWPTRFVAPNHLLEERPDGTTILQVLPVGPGESLLRRHRFTRCEHPRAARAAEFLASRVSGFGRRTAIDIAESTQRGIVAFGHEAAGVEPGPALAAFRSQLIAWVPALASRRPPADA